MIHIGKNIIERTIKNHVLLFADLKAAFEIVERTHNKWREVERPQLLITTKRTKEDDNLSPLLLTKDMKNLQNIYRIQPSNTREVRKFKIRLGHHCNTRHR